MSFLIGLAFGSVFTVLVEIFLIYIPFFRKYVVTNPRLVFGYQIHHSTLGLIIVLLGLILLLLGKSGGSMVVGFGIGMILVHTISDGRFIFIEKVSI